MIPFTGDQKVIEIGGGANPRYHPNLDVRKLSSVDIVADLNLEWPVESASFDGVYSSYAIEHISWRSLRKFVSETYRILKPGGVAFIVTANTEAQMRWALKNEEWDEKISQCVFGDLDYPENSHKVAFSPGFVIRLFREAGFDDVAVIPHGLTGTDMIVEARRALPPAEITDENRPKVFNRLYFDGARGGFGGYAGEGYWDYPYNWATFQRIMDFKPKSVLELGCARGYVLKRLEDAGVKVRGLDVSEHCRLLRATDKVETWDLCKTPWPVKDKEFDLCFSLSVLNQIPESKIPAVVREIHRVSSRGIHGLDFSGIDDDNKTTSIRKPKEWWTDKLGQDHILYSRSFFEVNAVIPGPDDQIKLNLGCFRTMFHHGWVNIDTLPMQDFAAKNLYHFRQADLRSGIPYPDETVDLAYACHFIEHLTFEEGAKFFKDLYRSLRPKALVRFILPDAKKLCSDYVKGRLSKYDELNDGCANTLYQSKKIMELLLAGHQSIYDDRSLSGSLVEAGFDKKNIAVRKFRESASPKMLRETLDLLPEISLYVEAVK